MFRNLLKNPVKSLVSQGLGCQQTRNTYILKRRFPPMLRKKQSHRTLLKTKNYIYEVVENTNLKPLKEVNVILTQYIAGLGEKGDVVQMKPRKAYIDFLLPGLAVYCSPENMNKYVSKNIEEKKATKEFSSLFAQRTMKYLSKFVLYISMNISHPWVLEPWHIRVSFRKLGFIVPEDAIGMPLGEIRGPDPTLENKEFLITVTINNNEKVQIRTRIRHWGSGEERPPRVENYYYLKREPLFPEEAETLSNMPLPAPKVEIPEADSAKRIDSS